VEDAFADGKRTSTAGVYRMLDRARAQLLTLHRPLDADTHMQLDETVVLSLALTSGDVLFSVDVTYDLTVKGAGKR